MKKQRFLIFKFITIFIIFQLPLLGMAVDSKKWNSENHSTSEKQESTDPYYQGVKTLFASSIQYSIDETIEGKLGNEISAALRIFATKTRNYDLSSGNNNIFLDSQVDHFTKIFLEYHYQDCLQKAHDYATNQLAKWSLKLHEADPHTWPKQYSFYDKMKVSIEDSFKLIVSKETGPKVLNQLLPKVQFSLRNQIANYQKKLVNEVSGKNSSTPDLAEKNSKTLKGGTTKVLVTTNSKSNNGAEFADFSFPDISLEEVLRDSPETLRYKFRKPIDGVVEFTTQYILFNIPMFFVTVANVGLDSAKNPLAIDQFKESLEDPATTMGFYAFIKTNHKVSNLWLKVINEPKFRKLGGFVGMGAGLIASSLFTEFYHDKDVASCAKSIMKDHESCTRAWNSWVLSGKVNELAPAVLGLLSTVGVSGVITESISGAKSVGKTGAQTVADLVKEGSVWVSDSGVAQSAKAKASAAGIWLADTKAAAAFAESIAKMKAMGGQFGYRVSGLYVYPKKLFPTIEKFAAYLFKSQKVKVLLNTSLVAIGGNLVFLAVDPFISPPIKKWWDKSTLLGWFGRSNLPQVIEQSPFFGDLEQLGRFALSGGKVKPPHEIDYQTIPQIFEAMNSSFDYFLKNNYEIKNANDCLPGDQTQALLAAENDVIPGLIENPLRKKVTTCLKTSDFPFWIDKYSQAQKNWRTYLLAETLSSHNVWAQTIDDFLTTMSATRLLYEYVTKIVFEYTHEQLKNPNTEIPWDKLSPGALNRFITENAKVPNVALRSEEEQERYKDLYPESIGGTFGTGIKTKEFSEYLLASMACGRNPEDTVGFLQNVKSMHYIPFDWLGKLLPSIFSTSQVAKPTSPNLEMAPGSKFTFLPPKITSGEDDICDDKNRDSTYGQFKRYRSVGLTTQVAGQNPMSGPDWPSQGPEVYFAPVKSKGITYESVVHYIIENIRTDLVSRNKEVLFPKLIPWFDNTIYKPFNDPDVGIWKVFEENYSNLLRNFFYPKLMDTKLEVECSSSMKLDSISCGYGTTDNFILGKGVIISAAIEMQTYFRLLNKIGKSMVSQKKWGAESYDFDASARKVVDSIVKTVTEADGNQLVNAAATLKVFQDEYQKRLPPAKDAAGVQVAVTRIFSHMTNILPEILDYNKYTMIVDLSNSNREAPEVPKPGDNSRLRRHDYSNKQN